MSSDIHLTHVIGHSHHPCQPCRRTFTSSTSTRYVIGHSTHRRWHTSSMSSDIHIIHLNHVIGHTTHRRWRTSIMLSDIHINHLNHVIGHSHQLPQPCHRTFNSSTLTHLVHVIIINTSHYQHFSSSTRLIINTSHHQHIFITQGISKSRIQRQRLLFILTASNVTINCHPSKSHPPINLSPYQRH